MAIPPESMGFTPQTEDGELNPQIGTVQIGTLLSGSIGSGMIANWVIPKQPPYSFNSGCISISPLQIIPPYKPLSPPSVSEKPSASEKVEKQEVEKPNEVKEKVEDRKRFSLEGLFNWLKDWIPG